MRTWLAVALLFATAPCSAESSLELSIKVGMDLRLFLQDAQFTGEH